MLLALVVAQNICFECIPMHPAPPGTVNLTYTMYIPMDHLRLPTNIALATGLGLTNLVRGDNQTSYQIGKINLQDGTPAYRIEQQIQIETNGGSVSQIGLSGFSRRYDPAQSLSPEPSCVRKNCPECPWYWFGVPSLPEPIHYPGNCLINVGFSVDGSTSARMETITATREYHNYTSMSVIFTGAPTIEFVPAAIQWLAPIGWANRIIISWADQTPRYTLHLAHDGFPSHEIRINGHLVYQHEPIANGQSPLSLGPPLDVSSSVSGIIQQ